MQMQEIEECPQPAMLSDGVVITAVNDKLSALFPAWKAGVALPGLLESPEGLTAWESVVALEGRACSVRCRREGEQWIYYIQPGAQQALSDGQLDGALYQLRVLMGEVYQKLSPCLRQEGEDFSEENKAGLAKSYYRMLRLMDHLDLLRDAAQGQVRLETQEVELGRFCALVAAECGGVLEQTGVRVEFIPWPDPVYAQIDGLRLRDAVLELVSNCAKRLKGSGTISLRLGKKGSRAILCVTDDGGPATAQQRLGMTVPGAMPLIPVPGMGAGLGLSAAQEIVSLHGGALLTALEEGAPRVYLTLGAVRPSGRVAMRAPRMERNAGMNPYVIALSDALPGSIVREDWRD